MVGDSIAAAMAAMPEASPGLTRADVESIVQLRRRSPALGGRRSRASWMKLNPRTAPAPDD